MRERIVAELREAEASRAELALVNAELSRSNVELEQFAYVASHDLQEPLRKVTSFVQLLQQRYGHQLDERGDQYIDFAVDGAKRMQILINDLLTFSRVGRSTERFEDVDLGSTVSAALTNLNRVIEDTACEIVVGPLPVVRGDESLLVSLWQNLWVIRSSFVPRSVPSCESKRSEPRESGSAASPTTASGSSRASQRRSSCSSSGSTVATLTKELASAWHYPRRSSSFTAGASGSTRVIVQVRACVLLFRFQRGRFSMNMAHEGTAINILLVEDDPGDVLITREALATAKILHSLAIVDDGEAAVAYLRQEGDYAGVPRPDLVFLDLNLPRLDGREVLALVKSDEVLRRIPIVVLTTSNAEEDVLRSYDLHAKRVRDQTRGHRCLHGRGPPDRRVLPDCRSSSEPSVTIASDYGFVSWWH